jgi:hypothetical protein
MNACLRLQQLHGLWQEYDELYTRAVEATKTEVGPLYSRQAWQGAWQPSLTRQPASLGCRQPVKRCSNLAQLHETAVQTATAVEFCTNSTIIWLIIRPSCLHYPPSSSLPLPTQVLAIASKKRTALKRKIQQAQSHCTEQLQEAEKKVAKLKTSSKKLPDITSVLQAFMS